MSRAFRQLLTVFVTILAVCWAVPGQATVIDFTGGTITQWDGTTAVTNNTFSLQGVDYYEENGFNLDFIGTNTTGNEFESIVGTYYTANDAVIYNDVIHGHWATGAFGGLTEIKVSQVNGDPFDLNYFILTSNTDSGGGPASGNEQTYIHASQNGTDISYSLLLPVDDWGFAGTNPQIFLDSNFDQIKWFSFTAKNFVDCFGMDNFYIDEPAPPPVPEPGTIVLLGSGMVGLVSLIRRRKPRG